MKEFSGDNYLCMDRDKTADKAGRCNDSGRKSHGMESSSAARSFNLSADS